MNTNRISFSVSCLFSFPALSPPLISFINSGHLDEHRESADCGAARWLRGNAGRLTANNLSKHRVFLVQNPSQLFTFFSQQQRGDLIIAQNTQLLCPLLVKAPRLFPRRPLGGGREPPSGGMTSYGDGLGVYFLVVTHTFVLLFVGSLRNFSHLKWKLTWTSLWFESQDEI